MPYKFIEIQKKLKALGFVLVRQKWSHVLFSNGKITFPVPNHGKKNISPWVESKIFSILEISRADFNKIK